MIPTPKTARRVRWSAMLVDVPDDIAAQCEELLAPLVVVRVATPQAPERLAEVQPLVTCALRNVDVARTTLLRERCSDVGSVFVLIPESCPRPDLERLLKRALVEAEAEIRS